VSVVYHHFKRFNVVGTSGSGKTTFSRRLSEVLAVPHIEMDSLFWQPNWDCPSDEEFFTTLRAALHRDAWVLDGNYNWARAIKWADIDCVIWLDYAFLRTIGQSLRRTVTRAITRQEIWKGTGNRESFRQSFLSRKSVVLYAIQTYGRNRRLYETLMNDPKHATIEFVRLRSPKEADAFLGTLRGLGGAL
jgi:adenylate kinase family enzyme